MLRSSSSLSETPSFESYSSIKLAEVAARVVNELKLKDGIYEDVFYSSDGAVVEETESKLDDAPEEKENHQSHELNDEVEVDQNGDKTKGEEEEGEDEDEEGEFEFHVFGNDNSSPISADEIFDNGQIKPMFPIFNTDLIYNNSEGQSHALNHNFVNESEFPPQSGANSSSAIRFPLRKLFVEERETASCSSSEADDLDGVPQETYCVWTPKEMSKKSNSTGSAGSSKRWRFRDLMHRSHSDGRDTYVFLTPHHNPHQQSKGDKSKVVAEKETKSGGSRKGAIGGAKKGNVHEKHYLKNRAMREDDRKKSYLPYRQDLVGFFANVNGVSRTVQPF